MNRPLLLAPSILSADFGHLADEVKAVSEGGADYIHVDVMDGHFVPNITVGPLIVEAVRAATDKVVDVHLMISDADKFIGDFAAAGADIISVHAEACPHLHRTVHAIKDLGKRASVVLNPATPLSVLDYVLADLDMVLLMTVNPGFGGQAFIPAVLDKVRELRRRAVDRELELDIEVDGGIKIDNAELVASAGANVLVSGSGVFKTDDYAATLAAMRAAAT